MGAGPRLLSSVPESKKLDLEYDFENCLTIKVTALCKFITLCEKNLN